MDKNACALCIGHFILAMNSIDIMTARCHTVLCGREPSESWKKKTLSARLKMLIEKAPNESKACSILRDVLSEAGNLCQARNVVAHAWTVVDAQKPLTPGEQTKWLLFADGHLPITFEELVGATRKSQQLSDRISECISAVEFDSRLLRPRCLTQAHAAKGE